jgi:hypothetical protein
MGFRIESVLDTNSRRFFIDYMFKCPRCFTKKRIDRFFVEKRDNSIVFVKDRGCVLNHGSAQSRF